MKITTSFPVTMTLAVCAVAGCATTAAGTRFSYRSEPVISIAVTLKDLDLNSDSDQRTMDERIRNAGRRACAVVASTHLADFHETLADCYHDAIARAHAQVQSGWLAVLENRPTHVDADWRKCSGGC